MISTPCIKVCVIDGTLCVGCGRTLDEIAQWGALSEPERRDVMTKLPWRLAALGSGKSQSDRPPTPYDRP